MADQLDTTCLWQPDRAYRRARSKRDVV